MMQIYSAPSRLLRSKFDNSYSALSSNRKRFLGNRKNTSSNTDFRKSISEQVLPEQIEQNNIQSDIYNYYCEIVAKQVCEFVLESDESSTIIELDLTDYRNHSSFVIQARNVLQKMLKNSCYTKTKIIGILKKYYVEEKILFFKWNDQYDVISILLHFDVIEKTQDDLYKMYNFK